MVKYQVINKKDMGKRFMGVQYFDNGIVEQIDSHGFSYMDARNVLSKKNKMGLERDIFEWYYFSKEALENMMFQLRHGSEECWDEAAKTYTHSLQKLGHETLIEDGEMCIHQDNLKQDYTILLYSSNYDDCIDCYDYSRKCYEPKSLKDFREGNK
jgi:hypothetical protein